MTRGEKGRAGVTLILFALMLAVMLVFVALAMDSGLVFNERRQDQSAVDAAVLAAAGLFEERRPECRPRPPQEAIITGTLRTPSRRTVPRGPDGWREKWKNWERDVRPAGVRSRREKPVYRVP